MTGRENLELVARLFGLDRRAARAAAGDVLDRLGLLDAGDRLVRTYSGGMRRRLDLGASLVGRPRLLLLDEPTTGLDPRSRRDLWDAIRDLVASGVDVLLTTQYLEEADALAREVVIVDRGRVIDAGTPDELKDRAGRDVIEVRPRAAGDLPAVESVLAGVGAEAPHADIDTQRASVAIDGDAERLTTVVRLLHEQDIALEDIALRRPSLDEVFLALTGQLIETGPSHDPTADDRAPQRAPREHWSTPMNVITSSSPRTTIRDLHPATDDAGAGFAVTTAQATRRTVLQFARTPQLVVLPTVMGALFLFVFRYIFGGAIAPGGGIDYVDFLIPGFLVTSILWTGMNAPAGVAEDAASGVHDRFRSLPVPRAAVVTGRSLADGALATWALLVTTGLGFAVGFRTHAAIVSLLLGLALMLVETFAFAWLFVSLGLVAGNAQAAQGMSTLLVVPLTFLSSGYVPVSSMPGWMQPVAANQPVTVVINAVRSLALGGPGAAGVGHTTAYWVGLSLVWCAAIFAVFCAIAVARFARAR